MRLSLANDIFIPIYKALAFFIGIAILSSAAADTVSSSSLSQKPATPPSVGSKNIPLPSLPKDTETVACPNELNINTNNTLTLMQAVQAAFCHHPQARQAWVNTQIGKARIGIARAAFFPTITATLSRSRDEQTTAYSNGYSVNNSFSTNTKSVVLNAVLFDFGARVFDLTAAQQLLTATLAEQDATLQTVFQTTAEIYNNALITQARARSAQSAKQAAQKIFASASARKSHGVGDTSDMLNAQANLARATHDEIKAKSEAVIAMGMLANAIGAEAKTTYILSANEMKGLPDQSMHQAQLLMEEIKETHPSILQARAELAAARAKAKSAVANGLPSVSINAGRYLNGRPGMGLSSNQSTETVYSLTLTVPLFEGFGHIYRVQEARSQVAAREIELERTTLKVDMDIWRSFQELKTAYAALVASSLTLRNTRFVLQAAETRYHNGTTDIIEWIRARTAFTSAEQEQIQTKITWRTAYLKFLASLGQVGFWALDDTNCCHP